LQEVEQILRFFEAGLPRYLELLESWVAVNSFTANPEGVNSLGRLTEKAFAELGFQAERVSSIHPEFGDHLVLQKSGSGTQALGLVSHLDTVFPADEELDSRFWRRRRPDLRPGDGGYQGRTLMIYMVLDAFHHDRTLRIGELDHPA
jgi:glutamate carboxypeptidase